MLQGLIDHAQALEAWFADPVNWSGQDGIPNRMAEHLAICLLSMFAALLVALPIGLYIGHTNRLSFLAVTLANIGRALNGGVNDNQFPRWLDEHLFDGATFSEFHEGRRPIVWINEVSDRKNPSLSASRIATSPHSGISSPSRSKLIPTSTSNSPKRKSRIISTRSTVSISECK